MEQYGERKAGHTSISAGGPDLKLIFFATETIYAPRAMFANNRRLILARVHLTSRRGNLPSERTSGDHGYEDDRIHGMDASSTGSRARAWVELRRCYWSDRRPGHE